MILRNRLFLPLLLLAVFKQSDGKLRTDSLGVHEIIVYAIAPAAPINWHSPATLYKSVKKSYINYYFHKQKRFLGHLAFSLQSSLLEKPIFQSIAAREKKDFFKQFFQRKIGLGVLGYPFQSLLETDEYFRRSIASHARQRELVVVRYQINETAAQRVLAFLNAFSKKGPDQVASSDYYGGTFWPLYEGEGAGCSALTIAALEVAGIPLPEKEQWLVRCKIPITLMGRHSANPHKVKLKRLRTTKNWYQGSGVENLDYVNFEIYDPLLFWNWVQKKRAIVTKEYEPATINNAPGLQFDYRSIPAPANTPIFTPRPVENFFLKNYSTEMVPKKDSSTIGTGL